MAHTARSAGIGPGRCVTPDLTHFAPPHPGGLLAQQDRCEETHRLAYSDLVSFRETQGLVQLVFHLHVTGHVIQNGPAYLSVLLQIRSSNQPYRAPFL